MGKSGNPAKANAPKLKGTISWFSNSPTAPTGYGMQSNQVLNRMIRDGLDVAVLSNYGREGVNGYWDSDYGRVPEYARGAEGYSQDVTPLNHIHHVGSVTARKGEQPNCLITLYDTWVLRGDKYKGLNVASWTPIDHNPVPPLVLEWCQRENVTPIAMSKWGQAELAKHGIQAEYVPHAVEPVFKPTWEIAGTPVRDYMGLTKDNFVVGMNFANKASGAIHRKAVAEAFLAFSIFAKNKPDAVLYLHTDMFGAYGGWKLADLLTAVGLKKDQVIFCDQVQYRQSYPQDQLAALYTAMDVYLGISYGEGFGVGTIEAQACGTQVIVSNICASPELVGDGWVVDCQPLWDEAQKSWFSIPNIPQTVAALEEAYKLPRGKSEKAIEFAKGYGAEYVYQTHWLPVLKKILK